MKRLMMMALLGCWTAGMAAQNPVGKLSVRPMAGVSVSTFGNGMADLYHTRVAATGGIEVECGATPWLGLSFGLLYAQQGAKVDGIVKMLFEEEGTGVQYYSESKLKGKLKCNYLNLPLMANIYIPAVKGLAVKAGVQVGLLTNDKSNMDVMTVIARLDRFTNVNQETLTAEPYDPNSVRVTSQSVTMTDICKSVDFGIPVGLSYEYKNVTLDARYYFGLTKIDKTEDPDNIRNRCLSITLGYRFHL